jgi:hypothetical protein
MSSSSCERNISDTVLEEAIFLFAPPLPPLPVPLLPTELVDFFKTDWMPPTSSGR